MKQARRLFAVAMALIMLCGCTVPFAEEVPEIVAETVKEQDNHKDEPAPAPAAAPEPEPVEQSEPETPAPQSAQENTDQTENSEPEEIVPDIEIGDESAGDRNDEEAEAVPIEGIDEEASEDIPEEEDEAIDPIDYAKPLSENPDFTCGYVRIRETVEGYASKDDARAKYKIGSGIAYASETAADRVLIRFAYEDETVSAWIGKNKAYPVNDEDTKAFVNSLPDNSPAYGSALLGELSCEKLPPEMAVAALQTIGIGETAQLDIRFADGETYPMTFSTANRRIATVDGNGIVRGVRAGTTTITVSCSTGSEKVAVSVAKAPRRISISSSSMTIAVDESRNLTAGLPKGTASAITFSLAEDNGVLELTDNGNGTASLKAAEKGTAKVIAKTFNGKTAVCTVKVMGKAEQVLFRVSPEKLGVGEELTAAVLLKDADNADTVGAVTYRSSKPSILSVDAASGRVKAEAPGNAVITAEAYSGCSAEMPVEVCKAPEAIVLETETLILSSGDTYQLAVSEVLPEGSYSGRITWQSNVKKRLVVDANGMVLAKKMGTVTVTARTYNGKTAKTVIRIVAAPKSMSVGPRELKLWIGSSYTPAVTFANKVDCSYTLESSDESCVSIDEDGRTIIAKDAGEAVVTVRAYNGLKTTIAVQVPKLPTQAAFDQPSIVLGVGETVQSRIKLGEGEDSTFTFSSDNAAAADVSQDGLITAVGAGEACIAVATMVEGIGAVCNVTVKEAPTAITLSPAHVRMGLAEKEVQLRSTLGGENEGGGITYTGSDPSVVSVDANGKVRFISAGTATITATTYNGLSDCSVIEVGETPDAMVCDPEVITAAQGDTVDLPVRFEGGFESYTVTSRGSTVASGSADKIKAISVGTAKLDIVSFSGLTAECTVDVVEAPDGIYLEQERIELVRGAADTAALNCSATLNGEAHAGTITYVSSDPSVAKVDASGKITLTGFGSCVITAETYNGFKAECEVAARGLLQGKKIGIDPGHQLKQNTGRERCSPNSRATKKKVTSGGGGVTSHIPEYKKNLIIGLKLRDTLEYLGAEVVMTRTTHNINISNRQRAELMNNNGVDFWLRLHTNGSHKKSNNGIGIYIRKSVAYGKDVVSDPAGLLAAEYRLAKALGSEMTAATGARGGGVSKKDTYTGNNWSKVPCALVEMGYHSNPAEDTKLASDAYQNLLVQGMVNAMCEYYGIDKPTAWPF